VLECALYNSIKGRIHFLFENVVPGNRESFSLAISLYLTKATFYFLFFIIMIIFIVKFLIVIIFYSRELPLSTPCYLELNERAPPRY
jgi:hypothetical protein